MRESAFTYTILQYQHDVWSGERINVGVLMLCHEKSFVKFRTQSRGSRLSNTFPGINRPALRNDLKELERWFDQRSNKPFDLRMRRTAEELGQSLLGQDDSSLRWYLNGSGITQDPQKTFDHLFERFVLRFDALPGRTARTDEQVFDSIKAKLKRAQLLDRMEPHTVRTKYTEVNFDHAIKNGVWHCVQPISLDSADEEQMARKAERWAGKLVGLLEATEKPKVYLVTGSPNDERLANKYYRMVDFLRHNPASPLVFEEEKGDELIQKLSPLTTN